MRVLAFVAAIFFVGTCVSAVPVDDANDGALKGKMVAFAGTEESYLKLSDPMMPEIQRFTSCWWVQSFETSEETQEITYWTYVSENGNTLYANDVKHLEMWINTQRTFGGADFDVRFGLWHHLCFSWCNSEGDYQIYKNGLQLKSGSRFKKAEVVQGGGELYIGQYVRKGTWDTMHSFKGHIASFNLWDSVIAPADIQAISLSRSSSVASGNLVAWTCFKDADLIGVETCDTVLTGEPPRESCEGGEFAGKVLQLDSAGGTYGYVQPVQTIPDLQAFTVCSWVKTTQLDTAPDSRSEIMSYRLQDNAVGSICIRNPINVRLYVNAKGAQESEQTLNDDKWRHLCVTWNSDGGLYQYIINGNVVASGAGLEAGKTIMGGGVTILGVGQRRIGANFDWKHKYNHELADFNMCSEVISQEAIAMLMTSCHGCCGDIISWHALTSVNITPDVIVKDSDVPYEENAM